MLSLLAVVIPSIGQTDANGVQLPSFKTFYTYTNINYRNDISFTPSPDGHLKGHLKILGGR